MSDLYHTYKLLALFRESSSLVSVLELGGTGGGVVVLEDEILD